MVLVAWSKVAEISNNKHENLMCLVQQPQSSPEASSKQHFQEMKLLTSATWKDLPKVFLISKNV